MVNQTLKYHPTLHKLLARRPQTFEHNTSQLTKLTPNPGPQALGRYNSAAWLEVDPTRGQSSQPPDLTQIHPTIIKYNYLNPEI